MTCHARGVSRTSPRATSSTPTPRRLTATRATADTSSRARPRLCSPRTPTDCDVPSVRWTTSSSPTRIVPAPRVPVTTVPLPRTVNERSTHRRIRASRSGAGSDATRSPGRRAGRRAPGRCGPTPRPPATGEAGACDLRERLGDGRARVGEVAPGDDDEPVGRSRALDGREVLVGLGPPALVGRHDEQHRRRRAEAGEHVADEALVPGHVDEGDSAPGEVVHA